MKIKYTDFTGLTLDEKINQVVNYTKNNFIDSGNPDKNIYFFDNKDRMYYVTIDDENLSNEKNKIILKKVIKKAIKEIEFLYSTRIINMLYFIFKEINPEKDNNIDLDIKKLDSYDKIDSLIVVNEDAFYINLDIYDCIIGRDEIKNYYLLSKDPIKNIKHCKIDPRHYLKGSLINLIK